MLIRHLNVPLTEEEYARLEAIKGERTWHEFVMTLAEG